MKYRIAATMLIARLGIYRSGLQVSFWGSAWKHRELELCESLRVSPCLVIAE